jgi:hypothetical protein
VEEGSYRHLIPTFCSSLVTVVVSRLSLVPQKDVGTTTIKIFTRLWLSGKSNFSRVTEATSTMEHSQLSLCAKTKRYRKYTLILSFIAFSAAIYGLAIETECKSNPPGHFLSGFGSVAAGLR